MPLEERRIVPGGSAERLGVENRRAGPAQGSDQSAALLVLGAQLADQIGLQAGALQGREQQPRLLAMVTFVDELLQETEQRGDVAGVGAALPGPPGHAPEDLQGG